MKMNTRGSIKRAILACAVVTLTVYAGCSSSSSDDDDGDITTPPRNDASQRDRMGMPAVNTALVSSSEKDSFNQGDPSTDPVDYRNSQIAIIQGLRAAVAAVPGFPPEDSPGVTPEQVVGLVNPDVIHLDLSQPDGFPNGRRLSDDTINPVLGLVLNRGNVLGGGSGISDGIDTPSPTRATFPYGGDPNP